MIGRRFSRKAEIEEVNVRGFDAFEVRLGDLMRGERATLGKSLLDVERELRIKASYVAAIENADPASFDTPGFIPGYVRSYARYLGMDPDQAFRSFCAESGFSIAHGMSEEASSVRKPGIVARRKASLSDPLVSPSTPFLPASESFLTRIESGAIGSALVLVALIGAIGYGGWSVLRQVQQVQLAPVENTPIVLADLDPLGNVTPSVQGAGSDEEATGVFQPPKDERLSRLYRPKALDLPVMVARDAPISTLDPRDVGTLGPGVSESERDSRDALTGLDTDPGLAGNPARPQVVAEGMPDVRLVAVRPAWIRVQAADGSVIFEGILNAGDNYDVPATEDPARLRVGESGAVYFAVNGQHYGPAGARGSVTSNLALVPEDLTARYALADIGADQDLMRYVAALQSVPEAVQD